MQKLSALIAGDELIVAPVALNPIMARLAQEAGFKAIYLSGGGAKLAGLCGLLEERMSVPVRLSEPFRGFTVSKNIDRDFLTEMAPYFAVGAGLSIRRAGDK